MARNTFGGVMRSYAGDRDNGSTPGVITQSVVISFDPTAVGATAVRIGTSSSAGATFTLPVGAVPISLLSFGGATGGTNPTVDIGSAASTAGFFNEVDCDTKGTLKGADGALFLAGGLTAATQVTGMVGSSAATGGTFTGVFTYTVVDDGNDSSGA